jgi:hypothetical protein
VSGHADKDHIMNDDQFDALLDDATHAVNNLIPDRLLGLLDSSGRSQLLVRINDALTPVLRDVANLARDASRIPTQAVTVAAFLADLIETHAAKCDAGADHPDERPAHIISEVHDTRADVVSIANRDIEGTTEIELLLDDGAAFRIVVEAVAP